MDTKLYSRLDLLADNTLSIVFERNRLKGLKLNVDKYQSNIDKNLEQLKEGIDTLSEQQSAEEQSGARDTQTGEEKLIRLQEKVDRLHALLGNQNDATAREILLGQHQQKKNVQFTAIEVQDLENGQILQLQQRIMDDQDQDLDHLSLAISRQRELGTLIGEELETHAQIIDETEVLVDGTDHRLRQAQKKLNYVNRKIKDNKSICIVIALIIIFFVLVALFR